MEKEGVPFPKNEAALPAQEVPLKEDRGSEPGGQPTFRSAGDAEKTLIDALPSFIKSEQLPKPIEPNTLKAVDVALLFMAFACITLATGLIPELVFKSEVGKLILDKVVPWFLNLGALAAILKTPDTVLAATRNTHFRWAVPVLLVFLVVLTRPLFTVQAQIGSETTIWVDNLHKPSKFALSLGHHEIEVRSIDPSVAPRKFQIEFEDFLH